LVNAIAPGFFPSKMANGLLELSGGLEETAKKNPSGRLGRGEDIAGAVVFLSSRASAHVNGMLNIALLVFRIAELIV
jgi:NAD(P)-dependent dehydrogenase (short-subunit alcohol dehydrogenase family)